MALSPLRSRALVVIMIAELIAGASPAPVAAIPGTTTNLGQHYEIVATLDLDAGRLDALETLTLTNRAAVPIGYVNLSVIPRALGYLTMGEAVTVNGLEVASAWTTGTNLRVDLSGPLAPDGVAVLRIPFELTVGSSAPPFTARVSRENGVFSFGEWFPIISREHDVYGLGDPQVSFSADEIGLDLTTTAPLPRHAVACPGLLTAPETTGTRWTCEVQDVRDFSFAVNPDFRLTTRTVGGTALRVYTETVSGEATADLASAALVGLTDAFGKYPWPDLVIAEIGGTGGFSMEYPRALHITRDKITDRYVIYHEVAHQWFYAQLGNDQMLEPWLDEGFADFSARHLMGVGENQCSNRDVDSSVYDWAAGPISGGDWSSCDGYFHAVFYRGTEFLNAVREAMGADAFFEAMRDFIERHRHGIVNTRMLLRHLAARTDADLLPLYRLYLTTYDLPLPSRKPGDARDVRPPAR